MSLKGKRILIAKPGLDGHYVGAKIIAIALRDAGADVIYTGLRKTPEYIARVAVEEDVDALGLSILSGSHSELIAETMRHLKSFEADTIKVFVGGTIPPEDRQGLIDAGAVGVFTSDQTLADVVAAVDRALAS
jgi:methylmalonyl-CoA mutase C-terminal domain/subunit